MKFIFHGAAKEVGRSCVEISDEKSQKRVILDAGIQVQEHGIGHPSDIKDVNNIDAVFISHGHLDHIGSLPLFDHLGLTAPIFCTHVTKGISKILLEDSLHIQMLNHQHPAYANTDINDVLARMRLTDYRERRNFKGIDYEFYNAGHIPGSASVLLEFGGKRIVYTGDFNTVQTHLLDGADTSYKNIDVLIIESTYGDEDHPSRKIEEKKFTNQISKILASGGSVIVPVFSLGRAQEIAILLGRYHFKVPIYMDGMARKLTSLFLSSNKSDASPELRTAMSVIKMIKDRDHRQSIYYRQGIFLTTSGMLNGGPVLDYVKHLWHKPENGLLMTGYQAPGTNGKMLLESERAYIDGAQIHFDGPIKKYDFSAHAGKKDLLDVIKKVKPKNLIINHGDESSVYELAKAAKPFVQKIYTPDIDQEILIE
jgi:putative mRNA 3-end processing factor